MMDRLAVLKARYVKVDGSVLKDLLLSQAETIDAIKIRQGQQLNEDESKIVELTSKLTAMKETLCKEDQALKHANDELSKHNVYLEKLEAERTEVLCDIKQLEEKQKNLKSVKPNVQDRRILEQGKKKLGLYRDFTRIYWDYEAVNHSIKGYVSNKCDYVHHFCYGNNEFNGELTDTLWHEIYLSTNKNTRVHDENAQSNIPINMDIISK